MAKVQYLLSRLLLGVNMSRTARVVMLTIFVVTPVVLAVVSRVTGADVGIDCHPSIRCGPCSPTICLI